MNINLLAIEWSIFVKIALLILAGIIFILVLILFIYEMFFKKNFVYKVTYYTTDDPEYAIRTTTAPNTSIVTVGKNEEGFVISKIILTKSKKKADLSDPMVSAQMDSYNIRPFYDCLQHLQDSPMLYCVSVLYFFLLLK